MALADSYAACPCGSEKKYKWCCQKAESYIERAQRLFETSQFEAGLGVINEGLAKHPESPWLLLRKALVLAALRRSAEARQCCSAVIKAQPDHLGASALLVRMTLIADGAAAAAVEVQHALSRIKPDRRGLLASAAGQVAEALADEGLIPAAEKHYELAMRLSEDARGTLGSALRSVRSAPEVSPWLKEPYRLSPPPEGLDAAARAQFEQAVGWAEEGFFEPAAAAFELLAANPAAGPQAERDLGLCRLWLGEEPAAAAALRRCLAGAGPTTEAVDLALLCQLLDPAKDSEPVEHVQLTWPLRDREHLLRTLADEPTTADAGARPRDPEDDESPEVACFHWLDRPEVEARPGLSREQIPLIQADILVDQDQVVLEMHDDGRMNDLMDRFTALAGKAIPPAHPRTKVIGKSNRSDHRLSWYWHLPADLPEEESRRLSTEASVHVMNEVWPNTPLEILRGRTPLQAAGSAGDEVALRAELLRLESAAENWRDAVDWRGIRARLGIPAEPEWDPQAVDVDKVPVGRLFSLPIRDLDDARLAKVFARAHEWGLRAEVVRAAREIAGRPSEGFDGKVSPVPVFGNLAMDASVRGDRDEALTWLRRGRGWGGVGRGPELAPHWDMLEIQIRALHEQPEQWVPELAVALERHRDNENASMALTSRLLEMGLLRLAPSPDRPGEVMLDSRPLQQLLSLYGPKVTTSSGYLGVSATKGEIWTPESASPGSSKIWTPGSDAPGAEERPRIILTGQ